MAFTLSRKEYTECYTLVRLLCDGQLPAGMTETSPAKLKLTAVQREEGDVMRLYERTPEGIEIKTVPFKEYSVLQQPKSLITALREWKEMSCSMLQSLRVAEENEVVVTDEQESFMDRVALFEPASTRQGPERLTLMTPEGGYGCALWSRMGPCPHRLLDGGRNANMKLLYSGARLSGPEINKINALQTQHTVRDRMWLAEQKGGSLRYCDVADRVFRGNLGMLDLHLGRLLTEMVRTSYQEETLKIAELTARMREMNPLKVKSEWIEKHGFYEYKVKQLLLACAAGMKPTKIFTGAENIPAGIIVLNADGQPRFLWGADRNALAGFLLDNTRLERSALEKDKYGFMERENNVYYFKLNLKICLTKR